MVEGWIDHHCHTHHYVYRWNGVHIQNMLALFVRQFPNGILHRVTHCNCTYQFILFIYNIFCLCVCFSCHSFTLSHTGSSSFSVVCYSSMFRYSRVWYWNIIRVHCARGKMSLQVAYHRYCHNLGDFQQWHCSVASATWCRCWKIPLLVFAMCGILFAYLNNLGCIYI